MSFIIWPFLKLGFDSAIRTSCSFGLKGSCAWGFIISMLFFLRRTVRWWRVSSARDTAVLNSCDSYSRRREML